MFDILVTPFMLLAEILICIECIQIVFREDLTFDKYMLGLILTHFAVCSTANMGIIPNILTFAFYGVVYIYCCYKFKRTKKETLIRCIVAFVLIGCIECMALIFPLAESNRSYTVGIIGLGIAYFIRKTLRIVDEKRLITQKRVFFSSVIMCGFAFVFVMIDFRYNHTRLNISMVLILFLVLLMFLCLYLLDRANMEIRKKDYELELQQVYGNAYEELLTEVRRRQHDFKNQIGAIYSMHMVAKSYDELIEMQREYADELQYGCRYDSILTRCNNTILAGYLYYRCIACEKAGIEVVFEVSIDNAKCDFAMHEIIEILGILIDNACESFGNMVSQNEIRIQSKYIRLTFIEDEHGLKFSVANPTKYKSFDEIENMFKQGYSSKGKNRGIGLARVRQLVNQYKAQIKVENVIYEEINWLEFTVEIK